jgi:hypothetical protein
MKSLRFMLPVVLMSLSTLALAQSDAQKSFDQLKTLAGSWQGSAKTDPPDPDTDKKPVQISLRVTSRGNALVHEMKEAGAPEDPARYDHPVTMLYLDGDRLLMTHYCDAGNRPRMAARTSSGGKTVEFDFLDVAGGTEYVTHAPCRVHHYRRQSPHRGLDLFDARGQARPWAPRLAADKVTGAHL